MSWTSRLQELSELGADDRSFLETHGRTVELGPDQRVFAPGKKPDAFLLLLAGTVRVQQVGVTGREIILYRVSGGESCIMTTAYLLSDEDYLAEGVTETPVTAIALAKDSFDTLIGIQLGTSKEICSEFTSGQVYLRTSKEIYPAQIPWGIQMNL